VVERKIDGLTLDDAKRAVTPTGMSALGVLKPLGWVERGWFRDSFAGEDVEAMDTDGDNSAEFATGSVDTVESAIAFYRAEVEQARRVSRDASSLDALSANETTYREQVSLRWIMVHMLEETARHAGHLDLMREDIDGQVGDSSLRSAKVPQRQEVSQNWSVGRLRRQSRVLMMNTRNRLLT
jgi:hypothetical protein